MATLVWMAENFFTLYKRKHCNTIIAKASYISRANDKLCRYVGSRTVAARDFWVWWGFITKSRIKWANLS